MMVASGRKSSRLPEGQILTPLTFVDDNLQIDWSDMTVQRGGQRIELSPTEFRLLSALFERRGWVIGHDDLVRRVWGPNAVGYKDNLKLYIWYLRRKIEEDPSEPKLIVTRHGLGYMFSPAASSATI
jgi:two-component system KDP operon response regulator KdpE